MMKPGRRWQRSSGRSSPHLHKRQRQLLMAAEARALGPMAIFGLVAGLPRPRRYRVAERFALEAGGAAGWRARDIWTRDRNSGTSASSPEPPEPRRSGG